MLPISCITNSYYCQRLRCQGRHRDRWVRLPRGTTLDVLWYRLAKDGKSFHVLAQVDTGDPAWS
jgi:hypothetical protein